MISDILSQLVINLDHYLLDPNFDHIYSGEIRKQILGLRDEADRLRGVLDTNPDENAPTNDRQQPSNSTKEWIDWMMSDESAVPLATPCFSQKDLLGRGWSKRLIAKLLGGPHWKKQNPHVAGASEMKCWRRDRVVEAEETAAFREGRVKARN